MNNQINRFGLFIQRDLINSQLVVDNELLPSPPHLGKPKDIYPDWNIHHFDHSIYHISPWKFMGDKLSNGNWFVTSNAIHTALAALSQTEKENLSGTITVIINHEKKILTTSHYHPIPKYGLIPPKQLTKIGIGTLIELVVEKDLLNHFPDYFIESSKDASFQRKKQILKRKRTPGKLIPLKEAIELTRKQVYLGYRKNKSTGEVAHILGEFKLPTSKANVHLYKKGKSITQIEKRPVMLKLLDRTRTAFNKNARMKR
ncbi:MAG: hypothetical protein WCI04_05700 [archaeon]